MMPAILMCNSRFWGNLCTPSKCSKMYVCRSLFWLKRDVNDAKDFVDQYKGARQGRDLIPYLFNIFIEDSLQYTTQETSHVPVIGKITVPGLLSADDLKIALFTVSKLQKVINRVAKHRVD